MATGRTPRVLLIGMVLGAVALPTEMSAQDSHYWTHQFGTRSNLLGGAVVGSVVDISASFYNPGALALIDSPDLFQTSKVVEATGLTIEGDDQAGLALDDVRLNLAPGFFGGLLPFKFLGNHILGYSIFTRYSFKATMRTVDVGTDVLFDPPPTPEDYFGELRIGSDMSESWFGLSWAAPLGTKVGLGVTQYLAVRSKKSAVYGTVQAYSPLGATAISIADRSHSYWNYDLLWKIGISVDWQGWSLGLATTTPRVNLFGSGKVTVNFTAFGQDLDGDGIEDPVFEADHQEELGVTYRTPPSVALGAARTVGSTSVHATAEWFAPVSEYSVLEPAPFVGQSSGDTLQIPVRQKLDHVINVGVGVEQRFSPTVAGYASFRTDFSARGFDDAGAATIAGWNIFYFTAGTSFNALGVGFTVGLGYGFGSSRVTRNIGQEGDFIDELPSELDVKYRNVRLIFAFAF